MISVCCTLYRREDLSRILNMIDECLTPKVARRFPLFPASTSFFSINLKAPFASDRTICSTIAKSLLFIT
jgi:hypothetical protein